MRDSAARMPLTVIRGILRTWQARYMADPGRHQRRLAAEQKLDGLSGEDKIKSIMILNW